MSAEVNPHLWSLGASFQSLGRFFPGYGHAGHRTAHSPSLAPSLPVAWCPWPIDFEWRHKKRRVAIWYITSYILQQGRACSFVIRISFFLNASCICRLISVDGRSCFGSVPRSPRFTKMIIIFLFPFLYLQDRIIPDYQDDQALAGRSSRLFKESY